MLKNRYQIGATAAVAVAAGFALLSGFEIGQVSQFIAAYWGLLLSGKLSSL